jgi:hypothetical protein
MFVSIIFCSGDFAMLKLKFVATLGLCVFLTPAFAQSLAEKERYAAQEKSMESSIEETAKQCKTTIKVKFDWPSFKKEDVLSRSNSGFCENVFTALNQVCRDSDAGLKAVQSSVKSVTCKRASPRAISLKNGELVFGIDYDAVNDYDAIYKFLKDNL